MSRMLEASGCRKRLRPQHSSLPCSKIPAMTDTVLKLSELNALSFASKHIPERTPKRWDLVSRFVLDNSDESSPDIKLSFVGGSELRRIQPSPTSLRNVYESICESWPTFSQLSDDLLQTKMGTYPDKSGLKNLVLLPPVKECCSIRTTIRNRPSFPLVYTTQGTFVASMYSSECKHCSRKYHLSYYQEIGDNSQTKLFYYDPEGAKYFQISSQTVFEVALIKDITNNISISAASFESRATVYNENFHKVDMERLGELAEFGRSSKDSEYPWKLTEKRIEDVWFVYSLVEFYKQRGKLNSTNFATEKLASQRYDVDTMCERAWEEITAVSNPWIHHKCKTLGCCEGYCSLDGLEKVSRVMCAASRSRVPGGTTPEGRLLKIVQCCPETPVIGGKCKKPSKYCAAHASSEDDDHSHTPITLLPEHRHFSMQAGEVELPANDDNSLLVGCKKASNLNRFYDRTAGILALVRPCGIIVNFCEMFTCESATQAYVFIFTTFGRSLEDLARLKYLGYDRTCDLHPFLKNLRKKGSLGAKILLSNVKFMVDLWHCNKHKEDTCMPPENPNCKYHPKLLRFSEVHGVNTECAEQAFKWMGKFKFITRKMTRHRYCFFIWKIIDEHNKRVERTLEKE